MIINALCAGSFIYLAFVLLLKSRHTNTLANRWLALFLVFVSFLQLDDALMMSGAYLKHPHLFNIFDLFIFGVAPSLYLAVFHFVQASRQFYVRSLWHFAPCFLILILSVPAFLDSKAAKLELIKAISISDKTLNIVEIVVFAILFLQCVVYLLLGYVKILRHQKNLQLVSSNQAETDLNWLKNFWYVISILLLLWIIEIVFYTNFLGGEMSWAYWLGTFYLGAYAIQQKEIYPFVAQELAEIKEIIQEKNLSQMGAIEVDPLQKEQLLTLMKDQKPYLDPELSLPKLAQLMHCSTHELSHLINQGFERNFYQFINTYRIEESKRLLQDQKLDHLNILAIGFEAGFNSKTTFNTTFKQLVGMSPLEFRKLMA
ncbi:helix-turn-helix domain-containing protein [Haliscomenobacter sp.]|uniref:helix-turn-helix domain-containing protein n=1 Tax=Haliscomenobacter sp. TaxID=2717303 RepID=UPI0035944080